LTVAEIKNFSPRIQTAP